MTLLKIWIEKFGHPLALATHVSFKMLFHSKEVYADLNHGITFWHDKDFYNAGLNFGEALFVLTE